MNIKQNMAYFCYCLSYYELLTYDQCVKSLSLIFALKALIKISLFEQLHCS